MFCDKENVNILTTLLKSYGVEHAIVCPGSRNAPIVHNLSECDGIECHSVVDERSAGFAALGIVTSTDKPVVVCVTSGSALLNVLPAAAEATYQHRGIIVVSADRPQAWIDQLDGQTIPQPNALGAFVGKSVNLPEVRCDENRWHCRRLICEAMIEWQRDGCSVHINVPISEPLFSFTIEQLPDIKPILYVRNRENIIDSLVQAKHPMIVVGQLACNAIPAIKELRKIQTRIPVLCESLVGDVKQFGNPDAALYSFNGNTTGYMPDFVVYIGGHVVSKRVKRFLRSMENAELWHVSEHHCIQDVSMQMRGLLQEENLYDFILALSEKTANGVNADNEYCNKWNEALHGTRDIQNACDVEYSQALAVRCFESRIDELANCKVFYANSNAIRLANIYATHMVECNRGINGIEGSLSTAAGASFTDENVRIFCVIGDLSFFYDQNALSINGLLGNFRILLLNNGCGAIFHQLPGLEKSEWRDDYIAASHNRNAEGICMQCGVEYKQVHDANSLLDGMDWLVNQESCKPMLLEVFTDPGADTIEYKRLFHCLNS